VFESEASLRFYPDRRKTLRRFLDDIRRVRNTLAHGRKVTTVQLEALDRYYEEITSPIQDQFDSGQSSVNPSQYLEGTRDELRAWASSIDESLGLIHESLDDLRSELTQRYGALEETAEEAARAARTGSRKGSWIIGLVVVSLLATFLLIKKGEDSQEALEDLAEQGRSIEDGVDSLSMSIEKLASLGGLIPEPKTQAEFIHNARLHLRSGNQGAAVDAYQHALQSSTRPLDLAREYVNALLVADGRETAMLRVIRWLDPASRVYQIEDGVPRVREEATLTGRNSLSVEAAVSELIEGDSDRFAWLSALSSFGERSTGVWVTAIEDLNRIAMEQRTFAQHELARRVLDNLDREGAVIADDTFVDAGLARDARLAIEAIRSQLKALGDQYWRQEPILLIGWSSFDCFGISFWIPDRVSSAQMDWRGRTYDIELTSARKVLTYSLGGNTPRLVADETVIAGAWQVGRLGDISSGPRYGPGEEVVTLRYTSPDGSGLREWHTNINSLDACVNYHRGHIEQTGRVGDGGLKFGWHGPGARALKEEYIGLNETQAARLASSRREAWAKAWADERDEGTAPCYWPQYRCEAANPDDAGFACGNNHIVRVACPPRNLPGRAEVDLSNIMAHRRVVSELRYSLGTGTYEHQIEFEAEDHAAQWSNLNGETVVTAATGGHRLFRYMNGFIIEDRFQGPLFLRIDYKNGHRTDLEIPLVDPFSPPPGWPETPLAPPAVTPDHELSAGFQVVEEALEDGSTERWTMRRALELEKTLYRSELVRHGLSSTEAENGEHTETMYYDGVPVAAMALSPTGQLTNLKCYAPAWENRKDYGPGGTYGMPPRGVFPIGPWLSLGDPMDRQTLWVTHHPREAPLWRDFNPEEREMTAGELEMYKQLSSLSQLLGEGSLLGFSSITPDQSRGPLVGGVPIGFWTDYVRGKVRAQGWVHTRLSDSKPNTFRVGRWTLFDDQEKPVGFIEYDNMGRRSGYEAQFDEDGKPLTISFRDDWLNEIYFSWSQGKTLFNRNRIDESRFLEEVAKRWPLPGPVRWP
jgi:general stress protein CsbA